MTAVTRKILSGMQVLLDQHWVQDKAIIIENGRIKNIINDEMIHNHLPAEHYEFSSQDYLIPGLIDLHIHGTHGHDVMDGTVHALQSICRSLAEDGVTGFLATTMSAPSAKLTHVLKNIAAVMPKAEGAAILGVHLEGPFLAKAKCGAQCAEYLVLPDNDLFDDWQKSAKDLIKLVTLAPELPGADKLIAALYKEGVIVSIGHTMADYETTLAAIRLGCTQATHLFNAMGKLEQRDPGALTALLLAEKIVAELIVDGVHVHPAIVDLVFRLKGKEGLCLVTDAMRAQCLGDGGFDLGGQSVRVVAGEARLANGTLAGSTLRLPQAIMNMVSYTGCSLAEAIYMATYVPAKTLGLLGSKGTIAIGKDADLVVLDAGFKVRMTMRDGAVVFKQESLVNV